MKTKRIATNATLGVSAALAYWSCGKSASHGTSAPSIGSVTLSESATQTETATQTAPATETATATATATDTAVYVDPDDGITDPAYPSHTRTDATTCVPGTTAATWPAKLSQTGCYGDTEKRRWAAGALPYSIRVSFYSGSADKTRALFLPKDGKIGFNAAGAWTLPVGTRAVKTFVRDGKPIETRILRLTDAGAEGASYEWQDDGKDAALLTDKKSKDYAAGAWYFPARDECQKCHAAASGPFLGLATEQMNTRSDLFAFGHAFNQIEALARYGYFASAPTQTWTELPRLPDPFAEGVPLDDRTRSYLHVNCASCHLPGGNGNANVDYRWTLPLAQMQLCDADDMQGDLNVPDSKLLVPGDEMKSNTWLRLKGDDPFTRMPQFAASPADARGTALIKEWIESLKSCDE